MAGEDEETGVRKVPFTVSGFFERNHYFKKLPTSPFRSYDRPKWGALSFLFVTLVSSLTNIYRTKDLLFERGEENKGDVNSKGRRFILKGNGVVGAVVSAAAVTGISMVPIMFGLSWVTPISVFGLLISSFVAITTIFKKIISDKRTNDELKSLQCLYKSSSETLLIDFVDEAETLFDTPWSAINLSSRLAQSIENPDMDKCLRVASEFTGSHNLLKRLKKAEVPSQFGEVLLMISPNVTAKLSEEGFEGSITGAFEKFTFDENTIRIELSDGIEFEIPIAELVEPDLDQYPLKGLVDEMGPSSTLDPLELDELPEQDTSRSKAPEQDDPDEDLGRGGGGGFPDGSPSITLADALSDSSEAVSLNAGQRFKDLGPGGAKPPSKYGL